MNEKNGLPELPWLHGKEEIGRHREHETWIYHICHIWPRNLPFRGHGLHYDSKSHITEEDMSILKKFVHGFQKHSEHNYLTGSTLDWRSGFLGLYIHGSTS